MHRKILALVALTFILPPSVFANNPKETIPSKKKQAVKITNILWQQPHDIQSRNLFYGPGGRAGQPQSPFRFIEEDKGGSNPKFVIEDARKVRWKVKLGDEAKPETAATRLLWAVGYFTDINYYLPRMRVVGLPKLNRGQQYVSRDGTVNGARLERIAKKVDDWSWFDNPFEGTKEFNGLRVMMALMNKWDLKEQNNAIYQQDGRALRYVVSDIGDTFGKTGGDWSRSKGNLDDYRKSRFVDEVDAQTVDLVMHSRPPILYAIAVPYYLKRTRMSKVAQDIPRAHARWIGQWLARLSDKQIKDAFRAANFAPYEVDVYAAQVQARIRQLKSL
jgi:hypothetical protein